MVHVPGIELAADLAVADRWLFATPVVARELRDWLRLHPRHPRYSLDGLTDRALALSRVEARLLSAALRAYPVTRRLGLPALLAAAGRQLLRGDGSVLVLTTVPGEDRVGAGRRLLRTWLALGRHGFAVHPLSQLIDCPATAAHLAERVGDGSGGVAGRGRSRCSGPAARSPHRPARPASHPADGSGLTPRRGRARRGAGRSSRAVQVRRPWSSTSTISLVEVLRPMCTGRAVPVTQPSTAARWCVQLSSSPTGDRSGSTFNAASTDPSVSASTALAPPCSRP